MQPDVCMAMVMVVTPNYHMQVKTGPLRGNNRNLQLPAWDLWYSTNTKPGHNSTPKCSKIFFVSQIGLNFHDTCKYMAKQHMAARGMHY